MEGLGKAFETLTYLAVIGLLAIFGGIVWLIVKFAPLLWR